MCGMHAGNHALLTCVLLLGVQLAHPCAVLAAGERRLLDLARVNLGAARSELKLQRYSAVAWGDINGALKWKCSRQPF
jgi:hypothetical protein